MAYINLFKDLISKNNSVQNSKFILITGSISKKVHELSDQLGIEVIELPKNMNLPRSDKVRTKRFMSLTTEKSWKIISGLLKARSSSIRALAIGQNVSYGWAHTTVTGLIEQGIAVKKGTSISLVDVDKLLNGVAWERPLSSLIVKEVKVRGDGLLDIAREITLYSDRRSIPLAFTGHIAGSLYTAHSVRFDVLQMYVNALDKELLADIEELRDGDHEIKLQILRPDRDVYTDANIIQGVKVVSPSQTLLDLAGLGYNGRDMTKVMVEIYGKL
ncbi:MAG: hypothetical protein HPY73_01425 [Methanomassiliicoccales archaeon]|nr:MAG: hypothetical protein HPY73_01425 [Methanomassiliicoccales archaeon]